MNKRRAMTLAAAALVAGLVIGNISGAFAVRPDVDEGEQTRAACESGLRLGPMMRDAGGRMLDILTNLTGLSADEVAEKRAEGESPAQISENAGVSVDELVDGAIDVREAALDEAVVAGTITREQADAALERMRERFTERVQSTETGRGGGCGMGGQMRARGERGLDGERGFGGGRGMMGERGLGGGQCEGCPNAQ